MICQFSGCYEQDVAFDSEEWRRKLKYMLVILNISSLKFTELTQGFLYVFM